MKRFPQVSLSLMMLAAAMWQAFAQDNGGQLTVKDLQQGDYLVQINDPQFAPVSQSVAVHSSASATIHLLPLADPATDPTLETELTIQGLPLLKL